MNAHSSAAPLAEQGVAGFVDNGNLKPAAGAVRVISRRRRPADAGQPRTGTHTPRRSQDDGGRSGLPATHDHPRGRWRPETGCGGTRAPAPPETARGPRPGGIRARRGTGTGTASGLASAPATPGPPRPFPAPGAGRGHWVAAGSPGRSRERGGRHPGGGRRTLPLAIRGGPERGAAASRRPRRRPPTRSPRYAKHAAGAARPRRPARRRSRLDRATRPGGSTLRLGPGASRRSSAWSRPARSPRSSGSACPRR